MRFSKEFKRLVGRWSKSKYETLVTCPKKFQFEYLLRSLLEKMRGGPISKNADAAFGIWAHAHARRFFTLNFKSAKSFANQGGQIWKNVVQGVNGPTGFGTKPIELRFRYKEQEELLFRRAYVICYEFWKRNIDYKDSNQFPLPETEVKLTAKINSIIERRGKREDKVSRLLNLEFSLVSYLDRVQRYFDREGDEIWDYKTFRPPSFAAAFRDPQLVFYRSIYYLARGIDPKAMVFVGLLNGREQRIDFMPGIENIEKFVTQLKLWLNEATAYLASILAPKAFEGIFYPHKWVWFDPEEIGSRQFLIKPGNHCDFCDFHEWCGVGEVERDIRKEIENIEIQALRHSFGVEQGRLPLILVPAKRSKKQVKQKLLKLYKKELKKKKLDMC